MSDSSSSSTFGPFWTEEFPPKDGRNLAFHWFSHVSQKASVSALQQAFPALLSALLFQNVAFDSLRSRPGHLFITLTVTPGITNRFETLHGGAIGALVETLGCAAIQSVSESLHEIVTDLNVSYMRGTPCKDEVEFEAKVLVMRKDIAVAVVEVRNKKSAKVAAQGRITMCPNPAAKL